MRKLREVAESKVVLVGVEQPNAATHRASAECQRMSPDTTTWQCALVSISVDWLDPTVQQTKAPPSDGRGHGERKPNVIYGLAAPSLSRLRAMQPSP